MAALLRDVGIFFFHHWVHTPMIDAASHIDHEKRTCIIFYFYACMWLCPYSSGAPLGSPLCRQSSAMSKVHVPVTKTFLQHID